MSTLRTAEEMLDGMRSQRELADAASELEQERVEKALAWQKARQQAQSRKRQLESTMRNLALTRITPLNVGVLWKDAEQLIVALDELERLEGEGV